MKSLIKTCESHWNFLNLENEVVLAGVTRAACQSKVRRKRSKYVWFSIKKKTNSDFTKNNRRINQYTNPRSVNIFMRISGCSATYLIVSIFFGLDLRLEFYCEKISPTTHFCMMFNLTTPLLSTGLLCVGSQSLSICFLSGRAPWSSETERNRWAKAPFFVLTAIYVNTRVVRCMCQKFSFGQNGV